MLTLTGVPCGILTGLTGISNTYLSAPLLHWLIGIKDRKLSGTVFLIAGFSALTGLLAYGQRHCLLVIPALLCGAGFLAGASVGARVEQTRGRPSATGAFIGAFLLLAVGVLMLCAGFHVIDFGRGLMPLVFGGRAEWFAYIVTGLVLGYLGRVTETWALLLVPAFVFLAGLSIWNAQGAALLILLMSTIPLGLIFTQAGEVEPGSSIWTSFGGVFGALVGSQVLAFGPAICGQQLLVSHGVVWCLDQAGQAVCIGGPRLLIIHGVALMILGMTRLTQKHAPREAATE